MRHLLVLDNGRLAGVLSLRDLLALELDEKDEEVTLLNAYVHYVPADLSPKKRTTLLGRHSVWPAEAGPYVRHVTSRSGAH